MGMIEELRPQVRARAGKPEEPWRPPELDDFLTDRWVLSFDQTLGAAGYAELIRDVTGHIYVRRQATLHPKTERKGFEGTWEKAMELKRLLGLTFRPGWMASDIHLYDILIEHPLVGPGHRPESSLMAGYVICDWAGRLVRSYSARHVSSVMCGNPRHDKKEIAAAVARYIPESSSRQWSEHSRDAAAMALAHLFNLQTARGRRP